MTKIFIDMDDTLFDYSGAHKSCLEKNPGQIFPQSQIGFFANLQLILNAKYAYDFLTKKFPVYFLTAPSVKNPLCYTEKRLSIEKHFGFDACKNLIICDDKSLIGTEDDILIDDRVTSNNQWMFRGTLIQSGSKNYPDWLYVIEYINNKFN